MQLSGFYVQGSLITNMLMGMWILNKRYSLFKYISVLLVTAGIIIYTLATSSSNTQTASADVPFVDWLFGMFINCRLVLKRSYYSKIFSRDRNALVCIVLFVITRHTSRTAFYKIR